MTAWLQAVPTEGWVLFAIVLVVSAIGLAVEYLLAEPMEWHR